MRQRLFDAATAEKLSVLHSHAHEENLCVCINYCNARDPSVAWIIQLFDDEDRVLVTGRGGTLDVAVAEVHDRWRARSNPVC